MSRCVEWLDSGKNIAKERCRSWHSLPPRATIHRHDVTTATVPTSTTAAVVFLLFCLGKFLVLNPLRAHSLFPFFHSLSSSHAQTFEVNPIFPPQFPPAVYSVLTSFKPPSWRSSLFILSQTVKLALKKKLKWRERIFTVQQNCASSQAWCKPEAGGLSRIWGQPRLRSEF